MASVAFRFRWYERRGAPCGRPAVPEPPRTGATTNRGTATLGKPQGLPLHLDHLNCNATYASTTSFPRIYHVIPAHLPRHSRASTTSFPRIYHVIPAKAGIQKVVVFKMSWIPAFAGMTGIFEMAGSSDRDSATTRFCLAPPGPAFRNPASTTGCSSTSSRRPPADRPRCRSPCVRRASTRRR